MKVAPIRHVRRLCVDLKENRMSTKLLIGDDVTSPWVIQKLYSTSITLWTIHRFLNILILHDIKQRRVFFFFFFEWWQSCDTVVHPQLCSTCVSTVEEENFPWTPLRSSPKCAFTIPAQSLHDGRGRRTRVGWRGGLGAGSRTDANTFNRKSKADYRDPLENNTKERRRMVRM